ncbi:conjugal transfer protein TraB [Streptomyces sp. NPDC050400]|uniref:conjugal transfer protein TraB n=1 Tax=Streptomyces sp. NPDC050400 TaxID=3365610 RepID=UPI0037A7D396
MSDSAPTQQAKADSDNTFKAVQHKVKAFASAMDNATLELEALQRSMQANASRSMDVARDIEAADLDRLFVELTNNVSVALGGAAVQVRALCDEAEDTKDLAHRAHQQHQELYGALDAIRSSRRLKTPKPGFFAH